MPHTDKGETQSGLQIAPLSSSPPAGLLGWVGISAMKSCPVFCSHFKMSRDGLTAQRLGHLRSVILGDQFPSCHPGLGTVSTMVDLFKSPKALVLF